MAANNPVPKGLVQLCEDHAPALRALFTKSVRDERAVEELMQELRVQAWVNRKRLGIQEPKQYLFMMAWNVANTFHREREKQKKHTVRLDPQDFDAMADRSEHFRVKDDATTDLAPGELEKAIEQLPPRFKLALILRVEGYTDSQIAAELKVSVETAQEYITKAVNGIRAELNAPTRHP